MTSIRHNASPAEQPASRQPSTSSMSSTSSATSEPPTVRAGGETEDAVQARILDAARELVLSVGVSRTTATDVARRAGVSRMTFYRRFPDVSTVLATLLTRELGDLVAGVASEVEGAGTGRGRLCDAVVGMVRRLATDPLLARVLDVDPEVLLPYVVDRSGVSQQMSREVVTVLVREGQRDGSVRAADPEMLARVVVLTAQSYVFSARVVERESDADAVMTELRHMLDRYLAPEEAP